MKNTTEIVNQMATFAETIETHCLSKWEEKGVDQAAKIISTV